MSSLRKLLAGLLALSLALTPAAAQVSQTGGGLPTPAGDVTNTDNACLSVSGTTQTFTAKRLGGGKAGRILAVSINWSDSTLAGTAEITGVTVDGNAMARAVRAVGDDQNSNSEIWYAQVSNGTTGDVVATFSTAVDGVTIAIYRLVNYTLTLPVQTQTGTTSATASSLVAGYATLATASRRTNVSTSLSNITNDYSVACGSSLWGVHASNLATSGSSISTTISPTTSTPLIAMAVWASGSAPLDGISGVTAAYSASRQMLTSYTGALYSLTSGAVSTINDQSGSARNLTQATAGRRPIIAGAGPVSTAGFLHDGADDFTDSGIALSNFITASDGYVIISFVATSITATNANIYDNQALFADVGSGFMGGLLKNAGPIAASYNWDGSNDNVTASVATSTVYVFEWVHTGGNVTIRMNCASPTSTASGNTQTMTGTFRVGIGRNVNPTSCVSSPTTCNLLQGTWFEMATFSTTPSSGTRDALCANMKTKANGSYLLDPANDNTPMFLNKEA